MTIGGKELREDAEYLVATTDYLARGGSGYVMLKGKDSGAAPMAMKDMILSNMKTHTIIADVDGRITFIRE